MIDTATCLYCDQEFEVTEYGFGIPCPLCHKDLDIFPDDKYYIDTPWGMIGIGVPEYKFWMKPTLTWMIKKATEGKNRLKEIKDDL